MSPQAYSVAAITIANGSDNVVVIVPPNNEIRCIKLQPIT